MSPGVEPASEPEMNSAAQSPERAKAATSGAMKLKHVVLKTLTIHGQTVLEYRNITIMKCTSLWSLSVALLVNLLHFLQQLTHVKGVWGTWGCLEELIHKLEQT